MIGVIQETPEWKAFFECYRNLPILRQFRIKETFQVKRAKLAAWKTLLETYKTIDPEANLDSVKKRVGNIRSCHRREYKKVQQAKKLGMNYQSNLWYYDVLESMGIEPTSRQILRSNIKTEIEKVEEQTEEDIESNAVEINTENNVETIDHNRDKLVFKSNRKIKKRKNREKAGTPLIDPSTFVINSSKGESKDDARIYADSWVISYQRLSGLQKIYAKRAIEEILILGQLGLLTFNTVKPPSKQDKELPPDMSSHISDENIVSVEQDLFDTDENFDDDVKKIVIK